MTASRSDSARSGDAGGLDAARAALKRVFGFADFRGQQADAIACALRGRDAVVLMPTGGGKSVCYQLPALVRGQCTLVISPLIALMQDQVQALAQLGIAAGCLNSTQSQRQQAAVVDQLDSGTLRVLYVAPERIVSGAMQARLLSADLCLIAIDEAHCVSQWGHDFRQDYLALDVLRERFPGVPRMALTATADPRTREDIAARLALDEPEWFVGGFDRPNIRYAVRPRAGEREQLHAFLSERRGCAGIVYCMSRRKVDATAAWLRDQGYDALAYHAGLDGDTRARHQTRFVREDGVIMVATVAFGMGIDKPDVRFVVHLDLPKSIEAYYQETGRAGRDGDSAEAWMIYGLEDVVRLRQMLEQSEAEPQHKRIERHKLDALLGWCETSGCRRRPLLEYFGEQSVNVCGNCDNCLQAPVLTEAGEDARKLLSCIYRTGQRFGAGHVIDVLRGADTEKVRQHGHEEVSTYALGADRAVTYWRSLLRQLMVEGAVVADVEGFGALKLSPLARPILRGETGFQVREDLMQAPVGRRPRKPAGGALSAGQEAAYERLRRCRRRLAEDQGVAPYMIFHDRTLREMVERMPGTLVDLLAIGGVGQAKLQRYGAEFLDALHSG
ncbi:MAG: DNA helicase RecQ [Gammaproteobacteria bacterium]